MKVLIIFAHPNPESFNHAILKQFTKGLQDGGHTFEVNDLYETQFDPILKIQDLGQFAGGPMTEEVLREQEKVKKADVLAFIYPVVWWDFPALLKGWFDRVMSFGFAFTFSPKTGPKGLLTEKKAILINTTLPDENGYQILGAKSAMKKIINDLRIKWIGISNIEHVFLYGPARVSPATREQYLNQVYQLGKELSN